MIVASTRVLAMDHPVRIGSSTTVEPHRGLAPNMCACLDAKPVGRARCDQPHVHDL